MSTPGRHGMNPLENPADIDLAVWWVLGRPEVFLNSVSDMDLLPLVLDAAVTLFVAAIGRGNAVVDKPKGSRAPLRLSHVRAPYGVAANTRI